MTQELMIPDNIQVPAHLAKRLGSSVLGESVSSGIGTGADYPKLSAFGTRWKVSKEGHDTVLEHAALPIIIVGANPAISKTYYATPYDPKAPEVSPDCFSNDGVRPDSAVSAPQHHVCQTCPMNAWGSDTTEDGKDIKACKDTKILAFVFDGDDSNEVWHYRVSPSSLKNLAKYHKLLASKGLPIECVITTISFNREVSYPQAVFSFGGFVEADKMDSLEGLFGSDEVKAVTGEKEATPVTAAEVGPEEEAAPQDTPEEPVPGLDFLQGAAPAAAATTRQTKKKVSKKKTQAKKTAAPSAPKEETPPAAAADVVSLSAKLNAMLGKKDD